MFYQYNNKYMMFLNFSLEFLNQFILSMFPFQVQEVYLLFH